MFKVDNKDTRLINLDLSKAKNKGPTKTSLAMQICSKLCFYCPFYCLFFFLKVQIENAWEEKDATNSNENTFKYIRIHSSKNVYWQHNRNLQKKWNTTGIIELTSHYNVKGNCKIMSYEKCCMQLCKPYLFYISLYNRLTHIA